MRLILNVFGRLLDVSLDKLTDDDDCESAVEDELVSDLGTALIVRGGSDRFMGFTVPAVDVDE